MAFYVTNKSMCLHYYIYYIFNPCIYCKQRSAPCPTYNPTINPTTIPTTNPTGFPTYTLSNGPTNTPSNYPSTNPSNLPTISPTVNPSRTPVPKYFTINILGDYNAAIQNCNNYGGVLGGIATDADYNEAKSVCQSNAPNQNGCWFGLNNIDNLNVYKNVDGTSVNGSIGFDSNGSPITGTYPWNNGEPNGSSERCIHLFGLIGYLWNDFSCDNPTLVPLCRYLTDTPTNTPSNAPTSVPSEIPSMLSNIACTYMSITIKVYII